VEPWKRTVRWAIRATDETGSYLLGWRLSTREVALQKLEYLENSGYTKLRLVRVTTKSERISAELAKLAADLAEPAGKTRRA